MEGILNEYGESNEKVDELEMCVAGYYRKAENEYSLKQRQKESVRRGVSKRKLE